MEICRLKKRADFLNCRNGARSHERAFVLQLVKRVAVLNGAGDPNLRIGFTVTKKIGNAVTRNRIKRRLREAVGQATISSDLAGHDAVLIARLEAETVRFPKLVEMVNHAFSNTQRLTRGRKPNADVANSSRKGQ